jgi:phenylalanyl-tRNA synthetase alpha chain
LDKIPQLIINDSTFNIEVILETLEKQIRDTDSLVALEKVRIELFGKKGALAAEFAKLKDVPGPEKKAFAEGLNKNKANLQSIFDECYETLKKEEIEKLLKEEAIDVSLYGNLDEKGALHPVMETMDKIIDYFVALNFAIEDGPKVEDDFHNFEALNLPKNHPARDMQDTFFFKDGAVLRTHTSPVQIRTMLQQKPPIRMIAPGAVFRKDYDITHTPMFHQVEGLVVGEKGEVSFANLKSIMSDFLHYMFGEVEVRFRPSFFPFTEPSAEVDISCIFCEAKGCRICSHTGWLEVLGCGIVDQNVFSAVEYENVSGYAFGLGVERFAMLLHKIPDLRMLFEGDTRLLEQFR